MFDGLLRGAQLCLRFSPLQRFHLLLGLNMNKSEQMSE